ncbi:venom allergen 5-like [Anopheles arabiensis]|uniref:venom allergen 5-like n=1 Tax=Anopheles arabiensis TaxID=7173 RepID=UPI001AADB624|nr:venom allergen 5-like [Anopheles arabiensis]
MEYGGAVEIIQSNPCHILVTCVGTKHRKLHYVRVDCFNFRTMKIVILMVHLIGLAFGQYQWTIFDQEHVNLCSESYSCGGRTHTMCYKANETHPRCRRFEPIRLSEASIKSFMMGHNGLRNKVATDPRRPATDMQFLHWDRDLQSMAERWVRQCIVGYDECDFIGNPSFPIGQNVFFHPKPILQHWEALALSTWFAEKDRPGSSNLSVGRLQSAGVSNYTQLIWARTQFVGCGAASMYGGHLIVCYYHPRGNVVGQPVYTVGRRACTGCPQERAACSHVFRGLCGIDDKHSAGQRTYAHNALLVLMMMMFIATVWSTGSIGWKSERM